MGSPEPINSNWPKVCSQNIFVIKGFCHEESDEMQFKFHPSLEICAIISISFYIHVARGLPDFVFVNLRCSLCSMDFLGLF